MSLPANIYKELENIVGPEYISDKEYILAAYRHQGPGSAGREKSSGPASILLPGTTEEVQAIVKACNRYGIKYAAIVSLFRVSGTSSSSPS
jgi:glycolate oxidase